jgi:cell division protein FtsN
MTHDYAKKPRAKKKAKSQVPGWVWLLTGVVAGVFISFLGYLSDITPEPAPEGIALPSTNKSTAKPVEKKNTTRFDFYTLLPEREVIVPEEALEDNHKQVIRYILQAGSFKHSEDADRLRAQLIMMGLDVNMEAVTSSSGETWHRVQVGPFTSRSKMSKARSTLINKGIDTLLLKQKIDN